MRIARRYRIGGRVQGVGFRMFTDAAARREGIQGWVQNLPDGRVEIVADGDADAIERFERAIRQGPPGARISDVEVDVDAPADRTTGFSVR
jgi:acylphosphatase